MNPKSIPKRVTSWAQMFFASVLLAVSAYGQITVTNTTPITIRDNNTADPYPSSIAVSNYLGTIKRIIVHLDKVTHAYPDDVDVLLVAPNGDDRQFILMSDAGGQFDLNGVDLQFHSVAAATLPDETQIVSANYVATDYAPADAFPGVTLNALGSSLSQLVGQSANGTWSLYVVDDQVVDAGTIGTWRISFFMKPVISVTNAVATDEDASASVPFTVNDTDTPVANLVSGAVFDTNFVSEVRFDGTGSSRTATIVPKANANGTTVVTLTVRDGEAVAANTTSTNITLTINAKNDRPQAPVLSSTSTTVPFGGISTNINVTLDDIDSDENILVLSAFSANNNIVSPVNVYFGGTGAARTVQIASTGVSTGAVTVTIQVVDPTQPASPLTNTATISVNVVDSGKIIDASTAPITVADGGETVSTNNVSGVQGLVKDLEVVLLDLEAQVPSDLSLLLVGPNGGKVVLMRAVGGANGITNRWVRLDDESGNSLLSVSTITNGTYRPTNGTIATDVGGTAPAGPYDAELSAFDNLSANGNWVLYVRDHVANSQGAQINGGWQLHFNVGPTVAGLSATNKTNEDKPIVVNLTVGDQDGTAAAVTVVPTSGNPSLFTAAVTGTGASRTLTITPLTNAFGTNTLTLISTDSAGFTATNTSTIEIAAENDSPSLSFIPKLNTRIGQPVSTNFTVGDVDHALNSLVITWESNNPKLLPPGSVVFSGTGSDRTLTVFPAGIVEGAADITVRVTDPDGASSVRTFEFNALAAGNPLYEADALITIPDAPASGQSSTNAVSAITVSGLNGGISDVEVTLYNVTHPAPQHLDILLAGPMGTNIVLMSDVGGSSPITNQTVVFRTSGGVIPANLVSGIYAPVNDGPDGDSGEDASAEFADVAGFRATTLEQYDDASPNGTWRLYLRDDTVGPRGGVIEGGWLLSIRTKPRIQNIPTVTILEDTSTNFPVTFADNQPGVTYTFTNTVTPVGSTTSNVVTVTTEQKGGTVIVTVTPFPDAYGTNNVQLVVTDGTTSSTNSFEVRVVAVADTPRVANFPATIETIAATLTPVTFNVSDPETADPATIPVTVTSGNTALIPQEYISPVTVNGSQRSFTFVSRGTLDGTADLNIAIGNDTTGRTNKVIAVTVNPNRQALSNTGAIGIPVQGEATPSTITVNNGDVRGIITKITAILDGFSHTFPDDVDVLLVTPGGGTNVVLMSDAGGGDDVSNLRLAFSATAASATPDGGPLASGAYLPFNHTDANEANESISGLAAPAWNQDITKLYSVNPVGTWTLYVRDDSFPDGGTINNGWILLFETAPRISQISTQTFAEDQISPIPTVPFTIEDGDTPDNRLGVTATVDTAAAGITPNLLVDSNIKVRNTGTGNWAVELSPTTNLFGESAIIISVVDSNSVPRTTNTTTFRVRITPVNDAPLIATFESGSTFTANEEGTILLNYLLRDVDTTLNYTNLTVISGNTDVVPQTNIVIVTNSVVTTNGVTVVPVQIGGAANRPLVEALANSKITAIVNDHSTTSPTSQRATNVVTVEYRQVNDAPTFPSPTIPAAVTVELGGSTTNIVFAVGDIETPTRELIITDIVSGAPDVVPVSNIEFGFGSSGDQRTVRITPVGNTPTTNTISFKLRDLGSTGEGSNDDPRETTFTFQIRVVAPQGTTFANTARIGIPDSGASTNLYPSTNAVSGLIGPIHRVFVTLDGLTHANPDDLDILLVSPSGGKVMLMSDAGGTTDISNVRLQFSDSGRALPDEGTILGGTNVYQASNYEGSGELNEVLAAPAPAGPYLRTLGDLRGEATANGDWKLYVFDDTAQHSGELAFGWSLRIVTAPQVTLVATDASANPSTLSTNEDTPAFISLDIRDGTATDLANDLTVSYEVGNVLLTPLTNFFPIWTGNSNLTIRVQPGLNQFGTNTVKVTVSRGDASTSRTVTLGFAAVDDAPEISRLDNTSTSEDDPIWIPVQITDPDTALSAIRVQGFSGNTASVSHTNITFVLTSNAPPGANVVNGLSTNRYFLRVQPNTDVTSAGVQIFVVAGYTNGTTLATNSLMLAIQEDNDPTVISAISTNSISVIAGQSSSFTVTVSDPEANTITVTATSDNEKVVRNSDITVSPASGGNGVRTISFLTQPGQIGQQASITVSATDGIPNNAPDDQEVVVVTLEESRERVFANTDAIVINDATVNGGRATPFPSSLTVSGLIGAISKVVVTIDGFNHTFSDDVDILLVSPTGEKVVLMSDAGGNTRATNLVLRFEQGAAMIPDSSLVSGTYSPTNYEGTGDNFFEAPAGAFSDTLHAFNGKDPSGTWRLYIVDDTATDSGTIARGWSLAITTAPEIVSLPNITIAEDTIGTNTLVIEEESFIDVSRLTFRVATTNSTLITTNGIRVEGTGLTRQVILDPNDDQTGQSQITIWVKSPGAGEIARSFILTVTNVNDVPEITTTITDRLNVVAGGSVRAPFVVSDKETDVKNLSITISSSNEALVPTNYIRLLDTNLIVFADANAVTDTPAASDVVITVSDGVNSTSKSFRVVVDPSRNVIRGSNVAMVIPTQGPAGNGYPSIINVSNVIGTIIKMTVTLKDVNHTFPDDLDIALVGPNGTNIVLMSDAGSGGNTNAALVNAWLSFADGGTALPDNSPIIDKYGTNAPTNHEGSSGEFPGSSIDTAKRVAAFAGFNGISPNGQWQLFVYDDSAPDQGSIAGWQISFETTAPTIDFISDVVIAEDATTNIVFTVADDQALNTLSVTFNTNDLRFVEVVSLTGNEGTRTLALRGRENASGTDTITIVVKDNSGNTVTRSFTVTVFPVNDLPVITGLASASTPANVTLRIPFTVTDVETPGANLVVTASNSNPEVATVLLEGSAGAYQLTVVPQGIQATTTVTVVANDGTATTTNIIVITIDEPIGPGLSEIQDQLGTEDVNLQVPFTITKTTSANPTLTVSHNNSNLVFSATISGTGTNRSVVLLLVPNAFGQATVTVTITDEFGSASESFVLTVPNTPDGPTLGAIADRSAQEDTVVSIPLSVSDVDTDLSNLVFTATASNTNLVQSVSFSIENGVAIATVNLVPDASGISAISITVTDGAGTATSAFALTVANVNDAPALGPIDNVLANEDDAVTVPLTVIDSDTALTSLVFSGTSTDSNLVRAITFTVTSTNAVANLQLATNAFGTNLVTISVSEGTNTSSQSFGLTVREVAEPPVFAPISDIVTNENSVITIPLSVSDPDASLQELSFFSTTEGTALVEDIQFVFGDANSVAAVITLKTNAAGEETITLSVSDGNDVVRQSFDIQVIAVDDAPVIGAIEDRTVNSGSIAQVVFTVTDPDTAISSLVFFGTTETNTIVSEIGFEIAGPNSVRATLELVPGASGTDRITFRVSDGVNVSSQSFNLTVVGNTTPATLRVGRGANNEVIITAVGTANATYVVEGTSNFNTWTEVGTITIGANGTGTLTVPSTGSQRFFRTRNQ